MMMGSLPIMREEDMGAPAIDDAVLAPVLAAYSLRGARVLDLLEASNRNDNLLVIDATGARYVLRRFRRNPDARRVEFQVRFQQHLLRRGFPTVEVVETRAGTLCVLADDGFPWVLFTHVEGREYDFGHIGQVAEAAQRLAQFQAVAETFPGAHVAVEYAPPLREWWVRCDENLRELAELLAGSAVEEELAYVQDWWARVLAEWPLTRVDALPVGWVHHDYHGRNMVFVQDEMRGLFDFDAVERCPLICDVAYGIYSFGREARGSTRIRETVAHVFLDTYTRERPLTREEWAAFPMIIALSWLLQPRFYAHLQQDGVELIPRFRRDAHMMRAVGAEMQRFMRSAPTPGAGHAQQDGGALYPRRT
jgi:Ser/Thr protein kinase RdoA (MazF antagonist)